jgi:probable rRNA maturation factor
LSGLLTCAIIECVEVNTFFDPGFEKLISRDWLEAIGMAALAQEGQPDAEIGIVITGQEKIEELNRRYLGHPGPTDVLSFPTVDNPGEVIFPTPEGDDLLHLGEVVISYPQAVLQAAEHQHSVKREVATLLVHGILHLVGYDHTEPDDEQVMNQHLRTIITAVARRLR